MSQLLEIIRRHKQADFSGFVRIRMNGKNIGWTKQVLAEQLSTLGSVWELRGDTLHLKAEGMGFDALTEAIDACFFESENQNWIPIKPDYEDGDDWFGVGDIAKPDFIVRRFFSRFLGIGFDSVMINGYEDGKMWLPVRGHEVEFGAGTYDVLVAGARQYDQSVEDALAKEGAEEISLTRDQLPRLKPTGTVQLYYHGPYGYFKDELFRVYDFDTAGSFKPHCANNWEIERFDLKPFEEVLHLLETKTELFKTHTALIMIDFLIRKNIIPKTYPNYDKIISTLHEQVDFNGEKYSAIRA